MFLLRWPLAVIGSLAVGQAIAAPQEASLTLAKNGKSPYRIVIAQDASAVERQAASELQSFLKQISGAKLPIITDDQRLGKYEIVLGRNRHLTALKTSVGWRKLGGEGFTLRTVSSRLVIAGGPVRGTLYGVYGFLEDYLGCRWLSSKVSVIPKKAVVAVGAIEDTQVPPMPFREVYYQDAMDPKYAARNKLNGNYSIVRGGKTAQERHRGWGYWCHTFAIHVPPDKYFKDHPEYFALVNGKRVPDTQLCLTDPEVFRLTVADLKAKMAANPEAAYWSVSQNDTRGNCQCETCKAIDDREGTPMGSMLDFANRVAAEFPDKIISTLSYQYTRRPPKTMRPAPNVRIMLCSIECNRSRPIPTDPSSASFRDDVENWSKLSDNVFVWDYVVQFSNLVSPFPNLRVLQPNMKFFIDNNAKGMFAQGNRERGGEFAELRAYLLAKLMWQPDCDIERAMEDFLKGYYGPAARPIRQYIDLMHDTLEQSGKGLYSFGGPGDHRDGYLSPEAVVRYNALFDEAERRAAQDKAVLLRVQSARLPLMYAQLQLGDGDAAARRAVARKLFDISDKTGLLMFNEWNLPTEKYKAQMTEALEKEGKEKKEGKERRKGRSRSG
ncbi:MAG: DUF4838 domain-containing protein [Armatimonadetes bacterium]|nr:DUF4838 domain-containing protein [Armatimonadota bacterium]